MGHLLACRLVIPVDIDAAHVLAASRGGPVSQQIHSRTSQSDMKVLQEAMLAKKVYFSLLPAGAAMVSNSFTNSHLMRPIMSRLTVLSRATKLGK